DGGQSGWETLQPELRPERAHQTFSEARENRGLRESYSRKARKTVKDALKFVTPLTSSVASWQHGRGSFDTRIGGSSSGLPSGGVTADSESAPIDVKDIFKSSGSSATTLAPAATTTGSIDAGQPREEVDPHSTSMQQAPTG
ncbi:unnamed protein product, partial [Amoebophrya sp. A25]